MHGGAVFTLGLAIAAWLGIDTDGALVASADARVGPTGNAGQLRRCCPSLHGEGGNTWSGGTGCWGLSRGRCRGAEQSGLHPGWAWRQSIWVGR